MSKNHKILVDMDGVLANFDSEVLRRFRERYPEKTTPSIRKNFYIAEDFKPEDAKLIRDIYSEPGFFKSLPLMDDAIYGWQRLLDLGYFPQICSSPLTSNPTCAVDKIEWLKNNFAPVFGEYIVSTAIITKDKHLYDGLALIDDRPIVHSNHLASWEHIVFDRPYNREIDGIRLMGWKDENLESILDSIKRN